MRRILAAHAARYPAWCLDDVYKLLHQAALGCEHAVTDKAQARDRLMQEIADLGAGPEEPLVDAIAPGREVVRVHLRPFVRCQFEVAILLDAFLRTAREFSGSADRIPEYAATAAELARQGILRFDDREIAEYIARKQQAGFPAIRHSPAFEVAYRPAYRVVARRQLPAVILAAA